MTCLKQIIVLPFAFFIFYTFSLSNLQAQQAQFVSAKNAHPLLSTKKLNPTRSNFSNSLSLPIYRVPVNLYKKYMIRVKQTDKRLLRQVVDHDTHTLYSAKSGEHSGYDYYLSAAFQHKASAESFMKELPPDIARKAILVKMEPNKLKCHCFGKF